MPKHDDDDDYTATADIGAVGNSEKVPPRVLYRNYGRGGELFEGALSLYRCVASIPMYTARGCTFPLRISLPYPFLSRTYV